jgi:hypothetical protein
MLFLPTELGVGEHLPRAEHKSAISEKAGAAEDVRLTCSAVELMEQQLKERCYGSAIEGEDEMQLSPRWLNTLEILAQHKQPQRSSAPLVSTTSRKAPIPVRLLPHSKSVPRAQTIANGSESASRAPPASYAVERDRGYCSSTMAYSPALGIDFYILTSGIVRVKAVVPGTSAHEDGRCSLMCA